MIRHLRALVATPVRQFQVVGVLGLAAFAWLAFPVHAGAAFLPRGGLAETFADLTAGEASTRWASFAVYLLVWVGIVAVYVLAVWGAALGVHSVVRAGRRGGGVHDDSHVPPAFVFWGAVALGMLSYQVSVMVAPVTSSIIWDEHYGAPLPAMFVWWAVALLTALAAVYRMVQRRRDDQQRERRRAVGRVRAAERRAARRQAKQLGRGDR